jgi:integrase
MGIDQGATAFLNEGLDGKTEYRFYWDRDVLAFWFYVGADRRRKTTSLTRPEALTAEWRAVARQTASEIVAMARSGRKLEAAPEDRVLVASTLDELRDAWVKEQVTNYPASWKTRRTQINNVVAYFEGAVKAGPTPLGPTPLELMVDDYGPQRFVTARMRQRDKATVKKEVGVMFQFLNWLHLDKRFISKTPPRPTYRPKDYGKRMGPQRARPVALDDEVALRIIMRLPEYAVRGGRHLTERRHPSAFPCRDWMRFAFETGLRPSTVARLEAGLHWVRGAHVVTVTGDIDKGRNAAQEGKEREVPLTKVARDILMKHAPKTGIIFGKANGTPHDIRVQWKRAAIAELGKTLGAKCAPYDLRHGANFRMAEAGGTVGGRMHMLGHATPTTNDKYMRSSEKAAKKVVELLDKRNAVLEKKMRRGR